MMRRVASTALILVFAAITCAGISLTAACASAVFHDLTETGKPGYLTLALDSSTPLQTSITPGASVRWLVEASLNDAEVGSLSVELRAGGDLVRDSGMTAGVEACSGAFDISSSPASCQGTREVALAPTEIALLPAQQDLYQLANLSHDEPRQLLVTISIPSSTPDALVDGRTAQIGLGVHAAGDDDEVVVVPPVDSPHDPPPLAATGADMLALGVLAFGLVGLGGAAWLRARTRSGVGGAR